MWQREPSRFARPHRSLRSGPPSYDAEGGTGSLLPTPAALHSELPFLRGAVCKILRQLKAGRDRGGAEGAGEEAGAAEEGEMTVTVESGHLVI